MVDIWLYNKAYPNMDCEYIEKELKKLKLYDFYLNVCETLKVWFEEKEPTAVCLATTAANSLWSFQTESNHHQMITNHSFYH